MAQIFIFSSRIEQASYYSVIHNPGGFADITLSDLDCGLGQWCQNGDAMHSSQSLSPRVPRSQACYQFGTNSGQVDRAVADLGNDSVMAPFSNIDWDCEYNNVTNPPVLADVQRVRVALDNYNSRHPTQAPLLFFTFFHPAFVTAQIVSYVDAGSVGSSNLEIPRGPNNPPDFVAALLPAMKILKANTRKGIFGPRLGSFYTGANQIKVHLFGPDTLNEFQWALKPQGTNGGLGANHIEFYYGKPDPGKLNDNSTVSYDGLAYALNFYRVSSLIGGGGLPSPTPKTQGLILHMNLKSAADVTWWNGGGHGRLRPTDVATVGPADAALAAQITYGVVQRTWNTWLHATGGTHIAHDELVAGGPWSTTIRSALYDPEAQFTLSGELSTGAQAAVTQANNDSVSGGLTKSGFSVWWTSDPVNFDVSNNVEDISPRVDAVIVQGQPYQAGTLSGSGHWDDLVGNRVLRAKTAGAPLLGIQVTIDPGANPGGNPILDASTAIHEATTANATGHGAYWPFTYLSLVQSGAQTNDIETFLDTVRTPGGLGPAPVITLPVSPTSGSTLGGTLITVNGLNFVRGATASIGGSAPLSTSVDQGGGSLTFTTPAHAAGTAMSLTITNPDTQSVTVTTTFQFIQAAAAPAVTSLVPATGVATGSTSIVINGTGFNVSPKPTITFGTVAVPSASIGTVTTTTIAVTTPAGTGTVVVVVTNPDTQHSSTTGSGANQFVYSGVLPAPTVSGVSPTVGPLDGTSITITGTGFVDGGSVTVGGTPATNYHWVSATSITCGAPSHVFGTVDVIVTNPDAQASATGAPDHFTYQAPAPTFDSLSPVRGPQGGGTLVTLNGSSFLNGGGLGVTFGGTAATAVTAADDGLTITCTTPAHAVGLVAVLITNADGQTISQTSAYTFLAPPPVVQSVVPPNGPITGGTPVVVGGTGFNVSPKPTVTVDGANMVVGNVTTTTIAITVPNHAVGDVNVAVTNPDGQQSTLSAAYHYDAPSPAPTIGNVSPPRVDALTPTMLTISGTGFQTGATVHFDSPTGPLGTGTNGSGTTLFTTTPVHAIGTFALIVVNPDGQSAQTTLGFLSPTGNLTVFPSVVNLLPNPLVGDLLNTSSPQHLRQHQDLNDTVRPLESMLVGPLLTNVRGGTTPAVGDGVADDTAAIHQSRDAAGIGGTVRFPSGTYRVTGLNATIAQQIWILEAGAMILLADGSNKAAITIAANDLCITGFGTIDGNVAGQTSSSYGVLAQNVSRPRVAFVTLNNCRDTGIVFRNVQTGWITEVTENRVGFRVDTGSTDVTISKCRTFVGVGISPIVIYGSAVTYADKGNGSTCYRVRVIDCYTHGGNGISFNNCVDSTIRGCIAEGGGQAGISLSMCSSCTVIGNTSQGNSAEGILLAEGNFSCTVSGNTCRKNDTGIRVDNRASGGVNSPSASVSITGNSSCENHASGISVTNASAFANSVSDVAINGNTCLNNGQTVVNRAGIRIGSTAVTDIVVVGNRCGDTQLVKTQTYGIAFNVATNVLAANNDVNGNLTAGMGGIATLVTSQVRTTMGWNPVGTNVTVAQGGIVAPVSTTVYTNAGPYDVLCAVWGGTTTAIDVDGIRISTAAAGATAWLPVGSTVAVTWSVQPTMAWIAR